MASCRGLSSRSITLRGLLELAPILQLCQLALWPPILLKCAPIKSRMVTVICSISALAALCGLSWTSPEVWEWDGPPCFCP